MYTVWHNQVWMVPFHVLCMCEPFAHHTDCYNHEGMLAATIAKEPFERCLAYGAPCSDTANWCRVYSATKQDMQQCHIWTACPTKKQQTNMRCILHCLLYCTEYTSTHFVFSVHYRCFIPMHTTYYIVYNICTIYMYIYLWARNNRAQIRPHKQNSRSA